MEFKQESFEKFYEIGAEIGRFVIFSTTLKSESQIQNKKLVKDKVSQKVGRNWSPCLSRKYWL